MVLVLAVAEMDAERMQLEFFTAPYIFHLPCWILTVNEFTAGKVNWSMLAIVRVACLVMALVRKLRLGLGQCMDGAWQSGTKFSFN